MIRLFALSKDGTAKKVVWQSECSDKLFDPCDLYERALHIEAADYLPIAFHSKEDGTFIGAIHHEQLLYVLFDLSPEQKACLEEFTVFVQQTSATIRAIRLRSFNPISKVRIWKSFRYAADWECLNASEMDAFESLRENTREG